MINFFFNTFQNSFFLFRGLDEPLETEDRRAQIARRREQLRAAARVAAFRAVARTRGRP